jgi:hypothetical protein
LLSLDDEDLEFVLRIVLASGSLKELAERYGVSYPTIRARLDRMISRLQALVEGRKLDPMAELLADFTERQELSPIAARKILKLHRDGVEQERET